MKGWIMIHKIKSLYEEGQGLSKSAIARELNLSRATVRKYLSMTEAEIGHYLSEPCRVKELEEYQEMIVHLLQRYPQLSSVKIRRQLKKRGIVVSVADRTLRRYVQKLREGHFQKAKRYYEPVIDQAPGYQCQIDGGELRNVSIDGEFRTVYFWVFVLSYSRQMYVSASLKAYNTDRFIEAHDAAFRFFGGVPHECVYDQTKLVVIKEEFREVWFNEAFYRYATTIGTEVRVCEGYDPESKGKVEAGVKYVKNNFFYGEEFESFAEVQQSLSHWLESVANIRLHGTTQKIPQEVFAQEESAHLTPYLSPESLYFQSSLDTRKTDKTSLISYHSNKYSVPMEYQETTVLVEEKDSELKIYDLHSKEEIASHALSERKGEQVINRNHYRDRQKVIEGFETEMIEILGDETALSLCALLKSTSPKIYRDQLTGLLKILRKYQKENMDLKAPFQILIGREQLKVSFIKNFLSAFYIQKESPLVVASPDTQGAELLDRYDILNSPDIQGEHYAIS